MNPNLFQRILFSTLLFFSFQATLIFVEMPLYIQLFFLLLSFAYSSTFLSLFLTKSSPTKEFKIQHIVAFFFFFFLLTLFFDFDKKTHVEIAELGFRGLAFASLYQNFQKLLSQKISFFITALFVLFYFWGTHFLVNNFYAFSMCFTAVSCIKIKNIQNILILMILSFIYEFYWVYHSDHLLYTLNSISAPIKILIPLRGGYSFIGIFDVIVPGIILQFVLDYDCHKLGVKTKDYFGLLDQKNTIYFNFIFSSYFVGLLTLYTVISRTQKSQALLCYALPACVLGVFFLSSKRSEMKELFAFKSLP